VTDYYVDAADGKNGNDGRSASSAFRDFRPIESTGSVDLQPGDTVYVDPSTPVDCGSRSTTLVGVRGTADQPITIESLDPGKQARVEFTGLGGSRDGWNLAGARHLHLKRLDSYTTDTSGRWGIRISEHGGDGSAAYGVVIEDCAVHDFDGNQFMGLANTRDCVFRRCTAYGGRDGGNADGFAVTNGAENYLLVGCEAYDNADDGYDLRESSGQNPSTLKRCVAHDNGVDGDGLGFKSGNATTPGTTGGTSYERCVSYNNPAYGFRFSGEPGHLYNCTAFNNGKEGFYATGTGYELANNVAFRNERARKVDDSIDPTTNSWNLDVSSPEFVSTDPGDEAFLVPASSSPLVDAGTDVGDLSYQGPAPDLGAYSADGTTDGGGSTTPTLKIRDGGSFDAPTAVRYYDGSAWVPATLKVHDADEFVTAFGGREAGLDAGDVLEDFERPGPLDAYRGDTSAFRPVSAPTYRETAAVQYVGNRGGVILRESPSLTVERGKQYRLEVHAPSRGKYGRFHFLASGTSLSDLSGYCVEYDTAGVSPQVKLLRYDEGSFAVLAEADVEPRVDEWVSIDVAAGDTRLSATVQAGNGTTLGTVAADDDAYAAGTYGFGGYNQGITFDALKRL
jgi:hypothetical protein